MLSLRVAALLLTIALAGCGGGGDVPEPPTTFSRLGLADVLPVRWIESADEDKQVREYYENVIGYEGEKQDIAVRAHLLVMHKASSTAARYELTEMRLRGTEQAKISKSSGGIAIEQVPREGGSVMVYRLDGGGSPENARTFVRFGDRLAVADPAHLDMVSADSVNALIREGTATSERVEIGDGPMSILNWKIGLRRGQELVVTLDHSNTAHPYTVVRESLGSVLQQTGSSERGVIQTFQFKAVAPGWSDLTLDSGLPLTIRVRVR